MPFGLPRRPEFGNMRLFKEAKNLLPERKDLALGIFYHKDSSTSQVEILAEIKSGITPGDKDIKLPGGNVERFDPTRKDTLIREFMEEAGFALNPNSLQTLSRFEERYTSRRGRKTHIWAQAFAMEFPEKTLFTPMPGEDITGYEWVTIDTFKQRVRKKMYHDCIDKWIAEINK